MKRILFLLLTQFVFLSAVDAQSVDGVKVENLRMKRNGEYMAVNMNVDFSSLDVSSNRAILFTPIIVSGKDSVELSSVGVYGRNRYYYYVRNNKSIIANENGKSYRSSELPENMDYSVVVPYKDWMNGAFLVLHRSDYGCCTKIVDEQSSQIGIFKEHVFSPKYVYVRPKAELEKSRSLSGSAYINFVVNKTDINLSYLGNEREIAKITATIDSVKNDNDIVLKSLSIKGFASPEGSYKKNADLAKGRTEALKKYVQGLYKFAPDFIQTAYEPEDWAGLRVFVETSSLPNKDAILSLIDDDREPDNKEWVIKSTYADDYKVMYSECYPGLRRSDYKVKYIIRSYTNIEDIKKVFAESPQKLSLEEFYVLAQQYENDTHELNDVFETAVRMYPNDPVANLNAAISEMQNNDITSAKRHLEKAGDSPEAIYARGIHAAFTKDYDKALELLDKAHKMGVKEAADAIKQVNEIKE